MMLLAARDTAQAVAQPYRRTRPRVRTFAVSTLALVAIVLQAIASRVEVKVQTVRRRHRQLLEVHSAASAKNARTFVSKNASTLVEGSARKESAFSAEAKRKVGRGRESSDEAPAIIALISNNDEELQSLCTGLRSTVKFLPDTAAPNTTGIGISANSPQPATVLIFHEGDLAPGQRAYLSACASPRPIDFPIVDWGSFPQGFDPVAERPSWEMDNKGCRWGYQQMCRFYITRLWDHPALDRFTTVMRLDSDACYKSGQGGEAIPLPGLGAGPHVYRGSKWGQDPRGVVKGLAELAVEYATSRNLTAGVSKMWGKIVRAANGKTAGWFPRLGTHFEVSRVAFMRRPDVRAFHHAISEEEPFGVFRHRWGDAPVRYITIALFASDEEVLLTRGGKGPRGYIHKECKTREDAIWDGNETARIMYKRYMPKPLEPSPCLIPR